MLTGASEASSVLAAFFLARFAGGGVGIFGLAGVFAFGLRWGGFLAVGGGGIVVCFFFESRLDFGLGLARGFGFLHLFWCSGRTFLVVVGYIVTIRGSRFCVVVVRLVLELS